MIEFKIPNEAAPLRAMSDALGAMADAKDGKPRACQCKPTLAEFAGVERAPFQEAHDAALTEQPAATEFNVGALAEIAAIKTLLEQSGAPFAAESLARVTRTEETLKGFTCEVSADFNAEVATLLSEIKAALAQAHSAVTLTTPIPVDAEGCPWDKRIHSSGKTLLANKCWRTKGGVAPELIATVKAEIIGTPATAAASFTIEQVTTPPVTLDTPAVTAATATGQPVVAVVPTTFPELVKYVVDKKTSGQLTDPQILEAISPLGITAFPQLAARADLIPQVYAAIEACRVIAS
jgi:hypothetical protein